MKLIQLTRGKFAQVDEADYEYINQWKWYADKNNTSWYAKRNNGKSTITMHQQLMGKKIGKAIDHKDRNGLNCQRDNLRFCSRSENQCNRRAWGISKYKGVYFTKRGKWMSRISFGLKRIYLGVFESEIEAAMAYNKISEQLHKNFSNTIQI